MRLNKLRQLVLVFIAVLGLTLGTHIVFPAPTIQLASQTGSPGQPSVAPAAPLGMNLSAVVDYTSQWPFVDAFKISRPWISGREGAAHGEGGELALTPEGWIARLAPGQFADTVIFDNGEGRYPAGQYTLLYDGEGKISFRFDSAKIVSQTQGRMDLAVVPQDAGIWLTITETNPENPLRNLRLLMPGFSEQSDSVFHPLFLERLQGFTALRFMDWQRINNSPVRDWRDRTTLASATQGGEPGVALEYQIDLANQLQVDPWFNIPHLATDEFVRQFAQLVRDRLDPDLRPHIEYSNEVWNGQFSQAQSATQRGLALGLSDDAYIASLRYYAQRSLEIFRIWEQVFGGTDRLVRILAGHAANPWTAEQILTWQDAYRQADAYAIAPYFSLDLNINLGDPAEGRQILALNQTQLMDRLQQEIHSTIAPMMAENAEVATRFGLPLYAYEGGQSLIGAAFGELEPQGTALFTAANQHPRMRQLYVDYLNQWQQHGGGLFMHFVDVGLSSKYGSWGALEYQDQNIQQAPKYLGLLDYLKQQKIR